MLLPSEPILPCLGINPEALSSNNEKAPCSGVLPASSLLPLLTGSDCQRLLELALATAPQILRRCPLNDAGAHPGALCTWVSSADVRQEGCSVNSAAQPFLGPSKRLLTESASPEFFHRRDRLPSVAFRPYSCFLVTADRSSSDVPNIPVS